MRFPFQLVHELCDAQKNRYHQHINSDSTGWHRKWTESIWRRHQDPTNAHLSGWTGPDDQRRRLIHFYDEYGLHDSSFALLNAYLWLNLTLPGSDIDDYREKARSKLRQGDWEKQSSGSDVELWSRGNLLASVHCRPLHPEDDARGRTFPKGYRNLEISLHTRGYAFPENLPKRPWRWFYEVGLRRQLKRGNPTFIQPEEIAKFLPAQVELGCGPSTEARIPHLSTLHKAYGVSKNDFSFVFKAEDDPVLEVFAEPERKFREMTEIYRACMIAESTTFYQQLAELWRRGYFVGPIITNNFDCLCADVGLPEMSLRRYDTEPYFPMSSRTLSEQIQFDPRAKSLLVVGVHADRRLAQIRARENGLKVIFIDPERYISPEGTRIPYPVEAPQDQDYFVQMTAGEAMPRLFGNLVQDA